MADEVDFADQIIEDNAALCSTCTN